MPTYSVMAYRINEINSSEYPVRNLEDRKGVLGMEGAFSVSMLNVKNYESTNETKVLCVSK